MLRIIFWLFLYILCLGFLSINIQYSDGLQIQLQGWYGKKNKNTQYMDDSDIIRDDGEFDD